MSRQIKWNEGEGYIITSEGGSGDAPVPFSSIANIGIDREQEVTVSTKEGVEATVVVKQPGLREVFNGSDGEFLLSDSNTLNVLKNGISE